MAGADIYEKQRGDALRSRGDRGNRVWIDFASLLYREWCNGPRDGGPMEERYRLGSGEDGIYSPIALTGALEQGETLLPEQG